MYITTCSKYKSSQLYVHVLIKCYGIHIAIDNNDQQAHASSHGYYIHVHHEGKTKSITSRFTRMFCQLSKKTILFFNVA